MKAGGDGSSRSPLARRIGVAVVGSAITAAGIAMLVLPGPAVVVIPLGLSILATEFLWARRYLQRFREAAARWKRKVTSRIRARSTRKTPPRPGAAPDAYAPRRPRRAARG